MRKNSHDYETVKIRHPRETGTAVREIKTSLPFCLSFRGCRNVMKLCRTMSAHVENDDAGQDQDEARCLFPGDLLAEEEFSKDRDHDIGHGLEHDDPHVAESAVAEDGKEHGHDQHAVAPDDQDVQVFVDPALILLHGTFLQQDLGEGGQKLGDDHETDIEGHYASS